MHVQVHELPRDFVHPACPGACPLSAPEPCRVLPSQRERGRQSSAGQQSSADQAPQTSGQYQSQGGPINHCKQDCKRFPSSGGLVQSKNSQTSRKLPTWETLNNGGSHLPTLHCIGIRLSHRGANCKGGHSSSMKNSSHLLKVSSRRWGQVLVCHKKLLKSITPSQHTNNILSRHSTLLFAGNQPRQLGNVCSCYH